MASISPPPKGGLGSPAREHRASVRYRCPPASTGRIYLAEDLEFLRAHLLNISTTGIGLLLAKPLAVGLELTVQLASPHSKKSYRLPARVVHSTRHADDEWLVGCQFDKALADTDVADLV